MSRLAFNRMVGVLKYKDAAAKMTNLPGIKQLAVRMLDLETTNLSYIPIYADLEVPAGTVAPVSVIEHFIRNASHRVIIRRCPCRTVNRCKDFDPDFGCTFLGDGAREIDPGVGRQVTEEEALAHLAEACEMGLVTVVGKFRGDAFALGVRDYDRLMTVCHCCPCCCVTTSFPHMAKEARDILVKLEGLEVAVGDGCTGCGRCVEACVFKQMSVVDGRAVVGEECKGCGRCAMVCKQDAISVTLSDPGYVEECIERIGGAVEVSGASLPGPPDCAP